MQLFPQDSARVSKSQARGTGEDSRSDDYAEEIPQPTHKRAARELIGQQAPGERSGADESREKSNVRGEILDRISPKVVELGDDL